MIISIQTRTSGGWTTPKFINVKEEEKLIAIKAIVMFLDEEIRVTYPSKDFQPTKDNTLIDYVGRLSGGYIRPTIFKRNPYKSINQEKKESGEYILDEEYWIDPY